MANVVFQSASPVNYSTLLQGTAYSVSPSGPGLYRKVTESERLNENTGAIESESGATQCYVVAESRISITVSA